MGRWAQRTRRGGGPPTPSCATIIHALLLDPATVDIDFTIDVDVADFNASDFTVPVDGLTGISIVQAGSNTVEVDLGGSTTVGSILHYAGTAPGVCSPQNATIIE